MEKEEREVEERDRKEQCKREKIGMKLMLKIVERVPNV